MATLELTIDEWIEEQKQYEDEEGHKELVRKLGYDPYYAGPVSWCCICGGMGSESGKCWGCQ